jgi:hypothetical protein
MMHKSSHFKESEREQHQQQHQLPVDQNLLPEVEFPPGEWSGLESEAMQEARCSLLIPSERQYQPKIKYLPRQRVLVHQDKAIQPAVDLLGGKSFSVDFSGAAILQLEASPDLPYKTMPATLTVAGRCHFTTQNYKDFAMMMRSRHQSTAIDVPPNGSFDWPDVEALLLCPVCGTYQDVPPDPDDESTMDEDEDKSNSPELTGDQHPQHYWMLFYPLLQIHSGKANKMMVASRTVCRLVCLDCMQKLVQGLFLPPVTITQQQQQQANTDDDGFPIPGKSLPPLSVMGILDEVGTAVFLQGDPPRPQHAPHIDDELDAWSLYQLWEHCGAWEALQHDYKHTLTMSMKVNHRNANNNSNNKSGVDETKTPDPPAFTVMTSSATHAAKQRFGRKCDSPSCDRVHGKKDAELEDVVLISVVCEKCEGAYYCSKACRKEAAVYHSTTCSKQAVVESPNNDKKKRVKTIPCHVCEKVLPCTQMKKCSKCRVANYCSVACQRQDWATHKATCGGSKKE